MKKVNALNAINKIKDRRLQLLSSLPDQHSDGFEEEMTMREKELSLIEKELKLMEEENEMVKIYNGTPHDINIFSKDDVTFVENIRKFIANEGAKPTLVIPSDGILSSVFQTSGMGIIDNVIPVMEKKITSCDTIPTGYDVIIVSELFMIAARAIGNDVGNMYTISDPVYTPDGRTILGCLGILRDIN